MKIICEKDIVQNVKIKQKNDKTWICFCFFNFKSKYRDTAVCLAGGKGLCNQTVDGLLSESGIWCFFPNSMTSETLIYSICVSFEKITFSGYTNAVFSLSCSTSGNIASLLKLRIRDPAGTAALAEPRVIPSKS